MRECEGFTVEQLEYMERCALACQDYREANRMRRCIIQRREADPTGARLARAARENRPTPEEAARKVSDFAFDKWARRRGAA